MKNLKLNLLILFAAGIVFTSCKEQTQEEARTLEAEEVENVTPNQGETTPGADEVHFNNAGLQTVFNAYLQVKNDLIASNSQQTADAASRMELALSNVNATDELKQAANKLSGSTDIEEQREAFLTISNELEKMLEGSVQRGIVYKQYCPMAFDGEGASWLSNSQLIRNPYFGDKMLECGSVQKTFR